VTIVTSFEKPGEQNKCEIDVRMVMAKNTAIII
jgi:hypothetical protein